MLWWTALGIAVLVVVPVTARLLNRLFTAAKRIRFHTAEILSAADELARNVEHFKELERTSILARRAAEAASELKPHRARPGRRRAGNG